MTKYEVMRVQRAKDLLVGDELESNRSRVIDLLEVNELATVFRWSDSDKLFVEYNQSEGGGRFIVYRPLEEDEEVTIKFPKAMLSEFLLRDGGGGTHADLARHICKELMKNWGLNEPT